MFSPIEMWLISLLLWCAGFSFTMPNMGSFLDILQTNTEFCQHDGILQMVSLHTRTQLSYNSLSTFCFLPKVDLLFVYLWVAVWSNKKITVRLDKKSQCSNTTALMNWGLKQVQTCSAFSVAYAAWICQVLRRSQVWDVPWWTGL